MSKKPMSMTRQRLREYRSLGKEIELLKMQIASLRVVHDTVKASMKSPPYKVYTSSIHGCDYDAAEDNKAIAAKLRSRMRFCRKERLAIEDYISAIPESFIRRIITLYYVEGLTWTAVAAKMGGGNTQEGVRLAAYRYTLKSCASKAKTLNGTRH